jgi:hypothetical protein
MRHPTTIWNSATKQWFCTTCGKTSDHIAEEAANVELLQYKCQIPYVGASENAPGEETVRLIRKPFKMVPIKSTE